MSDKKHLVVLSGAGISAESGLKTFRDSDGLWMGYNLEEVATPQAYRKNPQLVLDFYNMRRREVLKVQPNFAHKKIAALEQDFNITIITQNIDDLHERAGSTNVLHLHGEIFKMRSDQNESLITDIRQDIQLGDLAPDGAQYRPHIVWFHEPVPMIEIAAEIVSTADVFLVIGTSLQVYPAAGLVHEVSPHAHKFLIDKQTPSGSSLGQFHIIEKSATEGILDFKKKVLEIIHT